MIDMSASRHGTDLEALAQRIDGARLRSLDWLALMQDREHPRGVMRISAAHDTARWPGMLLPGTYNGLMCLDLLGGLDSFTATERTAVSQWLEQFRLADGRFRVPHMRDADVFKKPDLNETWRYIDWHMTNYSLGAVQALAPERAPTLAFAEPYLDPRTLKAWLADRDMRDPWQEGNNIVNLASFLLLMRDNSSDAVERALEILFDWHDRHQEPTTGFWGVGQLSDAMRLLNAFAGSMHNYHIWYALGRPLAGQAHAADYCLSLPAAIDSACIDVDAVDVLVHAHHIIGHRRPDIERWLAAKLVSLLDFQNRDGGFPDVRNGIRRQDGWVKGYEEPQGISNTFSTWFRWIALAMIADTLWPGRWRWRFRSMIGIGYRREPW
jgi:hypothetical protein